MEKYKLNKENWNSVYREGNVNIAYKIYLQHYNEMCPIQKILLKKRKKTNHGKHMV